MQMPITVILDGSEYTDKNGRKQKRDYVTILSELKDVEAVQAIEPTFRDVPAGHWAFNYIETLSGLGILRCLL